MKPIILFDFDGVICDSLDNALGFIRQHLITDFTKEDFYETFRTNFWEHPKTKAIKPEDKERFSSNKRAIIQKDPSRWGTIFPGIKEVIESLSKEHTLYVLSSNQQKVIELILQHYKLNHLFEMVLGRNTPGNKEEKIIQLKKEFPHQMKDAFLVTDSAGDVREAHQAGIKAIGVTWGIHDRSIFEEYNTDYICDHPDELRNILKQ